MFNTVVCGGTFDHFHKGHEHFLEFVLSQGEKILIGITSDRFTQQKKNVDSLQTFQERKNSVEEFLKIRDKLDSVEIEPLNSVYIPPKWELYRIDAIVVTQDSITGSDQINTKREQENKEKLKVIMYPLYKGVDDQVISSSRVRKGIINREGIPWISPDWVSQTMVLPQKLRSSLKKPFGELIVHPSDQMHAYMGKSLTVTVGDEVTRFFNAIDQQPQIAVVDFMVSRKKKFFSVSELGFERNYFVANVQNPPGMIHTSLLTAIKRVFAEKKKKTTIILVEGEEDLVVLPVVLAAPLGTHVFYGQPYQGVVVIEVSEEYKRIAYNIVSSFEMQG